MFISRQTVRNTKTVYGQLKFYKFTLPTDERRGARVWRCGDKRSSCCTQLVFVNIRLLTDTLIHFTFKFIAYN